MRRGSIPEMTVRNRSSRPSFPHQKSPSKILCTFHFPRWNRYRGKQIHSCVKKRGGWSEAHPPLT